MKTAEIIKSELSMYDVAVFYGLEPNRSGNIICPFHNEKTASLKIYKDIGRGFHCFGCDEGGSVIDFVMKLFHIDFMAACARLNFDFRLNVNIQNPRPSETARIAKERHEKEKVKRLRLNKLKALGNEHRRLWEIIKNNHPVENSEPAPEWIDAVHRIEYIRYRIEILERII